MKAKGFILIITITLLQSSLSAQYFGGYEFVPIAGTPHDVIYDSKRNMAYVSNRSLNKIDIIDMNTFSIIDFIQTGLKPMGMAITPNGNNLLVTLYDEEKIEVIDLINRITIKTINLPPGLSRNDPLRVEFDSEGTCIWRDGSGGNPYGYGYFLNVETGNSVKILPSESDIRFNPSMDKSTFIFVFCGGKACTWDSPTQSFSTITSLAPYGFGASHTNWPDAETINNNCNTILINQAGKKIWVFDHSFIYKGHFDIGMGWGTFGPWDSQAIVIQRTQTQELNKISLLDTANIEILETIELPENLGNVDDYDCGSKPLDITPDATKLLVVGQTGLFVIDTSGITEEEPISLEILGPTEIFENTSVSFRAIGTTESGATRDVTASSSWSVEPASAGTIFNGLLEAGDVEKELPVTIKAEYIGQQVQLQAEKNAIIFGICPYGYALSFDGTDDFVRVPRSTGLEPGELTIELWAKLDGLQTRNTRLVRKAGHFGDGYLFAADASGDKRIQIRVEGQGLAYAEDTVNHDYYSGQWHHFAGVYSQSDISLYIDGLEISTANHTLGPAIYDMADLFIGSGRPSPDDSEFFRGLIDELRIWDYPRTQEQIQSTMHTRLGGTESGLVGYWDFDEGSGQIVYDLSGNGNNGFLGDDPNNPDSADPMWIESEAPVGICSSYLIAKNLIEKAIKAKQAMLTELQKQIKNENTAIDALNEMLDNKEFDIVNRQEIIDTKNNTHAAIQTEKLCALQLNKSIERLIEALLNLAPDSVNNFNQKQLTSDYEITTIDNVFSLPVEPDADISGDGKVDSEDLAILCHQWMRGTTP